MTIFTVVDVKCLVWGEADVTGMTQRVAVGDAVTVTAIPEPEGALWPQGRPTWSGDGWSGNGATASLDTSSPGVYPVTATCGNSKTATFVVVEVGSLRYDPGTGFVDVSGTTRYVAVGDQVMVTALPNPEGASWPAGRPYWSGSGWTLYGTTAMLDTATPGTYPVTASCGNSKTATFVVVGVKKIQMDTTGNGDWVDVDGDPTEVLLKGTKYTFKAIKDPENAASWPSGWPTWSSSWWNMSRTENGDQTVVTFTGQGDGNTLTATCGSSNRTVTMDSIVPQVKRMEMSTASGNSTGIDMLHAEEYWDSVGGGDNSACFIQGAPTQVGVSFYHAKPLSFATEVHIFANVDYFQEDMTGGDYRESVVTFPASSWATTFPIQSQGNTDTEVDFNTSVGMNWEYKVPTGTNAWYSTGSVSNLKYYVIWATPVAPQATPWYEVIQKATAWAVDQRSAAGAAGAVVGAVYGSGYVYASSGPYAGAPRYFDSSNGKFDLGNALLTWGTNTPRGVNCWDTAQMVAVFGNALGCNMQTFTMRRTGNPPPVFLLNYIKPIGLDWTNDPFGGGVPRSGFSCHWTAYLANIYDACLKLDNDSDPTAPGHSAILPIDFVFDAGTPTQFDDYRGKLVDPVHESSVGGGAVAPASVE
jgi:hypothetical protein